MDNTTERTIFVITNRPVSDIQKVYPRRKFKKEKGLYNLTGLRVQQSLNKTNAFVLGEDDSTSVKNVLTEVYQLMETNQRGLLFFVHGYNNDLQFTVDRALELQKEYEVEVLVFAWPADGNGMTGVMHYKEDKRQAQLSGVTFDKVLEELNAFHKNYTKENEFKYPLTLMLHSMGNYLLQRYVQSDNYEQETKIFGNILMVAPDVNSKLHEEWVDRIERKKNICIFINEFDMALAASQAKSGEEQLERLGHSCKNLNCRNAIYIDLSNAPGVNKSHAYFIEQEVLEKNEDIRDGFYELIHGGDVVALRSYVHHNGSHVTKSSVGWIATFAKKLLGW